MNDFYIQPELHYVVAEALEYAPLPRVTYSCSRCNCAVHFPLVAREREIEILQNLIRGVEKFCQEEGITARMLAAGLATCFTQIAINKVKNESSDPGQRYAAPPAD